jgi:hypothetical protein
MRTRNRPPIVRFTYDRHGDIVDLDDVHVTAGPRPPGGGLTGRALPPRRTDRARAPGSDGTLPRLFGID